MPIIRVTTEERGPLVGSNLLIVAIHTSTTYIVFGQHTHAVSLLETQFCFYLCDGLVLLPII